MVVVCVLIVVLDSVTSPGGSYSRMRAIFRSLLARDYVLIILSPTHHHFPPNVNKELSLRLPCDYLHLDDDDDGTRASGDRKGECVVVPDPMLYERTPMEAMQMLAEVLQCRKGIMNIDQIYVQTFLWQEKPLVWELDKDGTHGGGGALHRLAMLLGRRCT